MPTFRKSPITSALWLEASWNAMAHVQKPDFVFRRNGRVHLNRRGRQFSRLLRAEVCASAVVMLDTPCSEVVWRVLATHSIRQFPLHFPSRVSPCVITFQLDSTTVHPNIPVRATQSAQSPSRRLVDLTELRYQLTRSLHDSMCCSLTLDTACTKSNIKSICCSLTNKSTFIKLGKV